MTRLLIFIQLFSIVSCNLESTQASYPAIKQNTERENQAVEESSKIISDTLLNSDEYLILGFGIENIAIVNKSEREKFSNLAVLSIYGDEVILGEKVEPNEWKVYKKFTPTTSFDNHHAEIFEGELSDPVFSSYRGLEEEFKLRIVNECEKGINFGGHFTLVSWGCGSPCQSGVVVNRKSGRIFSGYNSSLGLEFRKDSKLIIANIGALDEETGLIETCNYCELKLEVWAGNKFNRIE